MRFRDMRLRRAASLFVIPLVLLVGGCSEDETRGGDSNFDEGTLSSSDRTPETTSTREVPETTPTGSSAEAVSLRVEGADSTRFSGICTVGDREEVISGSPPESYSFEDRSFSCNIEKQDSRGGNLKVTVVSGDSARSVQQTNAEGGTIDLSYGSSR